MILLPTSLVQLYVGQNYSSPQNGGHDLSFLFSPHPPSSDSSLFLAYFLFGFLERGIPWALSLSLGHSFICIPPASFYQGMEWQQSFDPCHSRSRNPLVQRYVPGDGHSYKLFITCVKVLIYKFIKVTFCLILSLYGTWLWGVYTFVVCPSRGQFFLPAFSFFMRTLPKPFCPFTSLQYRFCVYIFIMSTALT